MVSTATVFFVTLITLLLVLWSCYWRLQVMYNSSILSLYTPDTFPVNPQYRTQHDEMVSLGEKMVRKRRIVIATMVRDVYAKLPQIRKKAESVGGMFGDYRILVVENDSKDGTRKGLLDWARTNPRVVVLGCGINAPECSLPKATTKTEGHHVDRPRIEKMVKLRNIYLDEIKKSYRDWDYVAMWDLDAVGTVYLDGIAHTIGVMESEPDVSVVCAYGIYRWGIFTLFYDTYALLHPGEQFHIDLKTIHDIRKGVWEAKYQRGDPPVEVDSCFSGFAIYRTSSLLPTDVIYDMSPPDNLECEHVRLNTKIRGIKLLNPSMTNFVLLND